MPKLPLLIAALTLALPVSVQADPPGRWTAAQALEYCRAVVAEEPSLPFGDCVSYFLSGGPGYLTQYCRYLDGSGQLDALGVTFSECVRAIRQD